jgi:hypothetical protein
MEYYKNLSLESLFYINDDGLVCCEEWRGINGYKTFYKASDLGRIKSSMPHNGTNERILSQTIATKGYLGCGLYKNKRRRSFQVHRIIAETFIPNPDNLPEVNHKKGNKKDNVAISLEWSSHNDNIEHAVKNSLMQKGETSHKSKLKEWQVLEIRASNLYPTELSMKYNVSKNTIAGIKKRIYWTHI